MKIKAIYPAFSQSIGELKDLAGLFKMFATFLSIFIFLFLFCRMYVEITMMKRQLQLAYEEREQLKRKNEALKDGLSLSVDGMKKTSLLPLYFQNRVIRVEIP